MSLIIPNAKIGLFDSEGKLVLEMPSIFDTAVQAVLSKCWRKHNGYIKVGLDVPFKPRSRRAQGKFHAICHALAPLVDMTADECKKYIKMEATAIGYAMVAKTIFRGTSRERTFYEPKSEADASTTEEALLIDTALKLGAEVGHDLETEWQNSMRGM